MNKLSKFFRDFCIVFSVVSIIVIGFNALPSQAIMSDINTSDLETLTVDDLTFTDATGTNLTVDNLTVLVSFDATAGTTDIATTTIEATGVNPILTVIQNGAGLALDITGDVDIGGNATITSATGNITTEGNFVFNGTSNIISHNTFSQDITMNTLTAAVAAQAGNLVFQPGTGIGGGTNYGDIILSGSGGFTGIGTGTPSYLLDVDGDFRVGEAGQGYTFLVDATTGNVGLGTTTPKSVLSVSNLTQSSTNLLTVASTTNAVYLQVQSTGDIKVASNKWFKSFDNAGTGDLNWFKASISDELLLGTTLNVDGGLTLPEDWGQAYMINSPVSDSPAQGTVMAYDLGIDFKSILRIYSEADSSGGIQNERVGIGTTTPKALLDIFSTATTTVEIDSNHVSRGGCLKMKDVDGGGYSYGTVLNGVITWSIVSCE